MKKHFQRQFLTVLFSLMALVGAMAQKTTSVRGQVIDAKTKETMPYVNVQFDGTTIGVTSDIDGNFYFETKTNVSKIKITYVGYKTKVISIKQGGVNELKIELEEGSNQLQEVTVKVERYRNKGNPAVELIKKVIDNKDKNRKEQFKYYSFNKYEKVEFALNNITDKMKRNFLFKKINFIFDNADTNKASGKVNLPLFLRELSSDVYYRKSPKSLKEYIHGERNVTVDKLFDNLGLSQLITNMYQDVNFYEDAIELLTTQFISPLSPISPTIYRFYIQDTSVIKGTPMVHMYFAPRNKTDLAFQGHMWVALDSTYSLRKIEVGIPKDINLNWVNEMQVTQEYDWYETPQLDGTITRGLMLSKDEIFMDYGFLKADSTRSALGRKTTSYRDYTINMPLGDTLFRSQANTFRDNDIYKKDANFWADNRHDTLNKREQGIYKTVDSLNNSKSFRRTIGALKFLFEGYSSIGGFDLGPVNTFYSFNPIEGFRARVGGRTNMRFSPFLMLEGYAAYGSRDGRWKGMAQARFNFSGEKFLNFPLNQLRLWYQNDIQIPGQELLFVNEDNFLLSFKRGINNRMYYKETIGAEYYNENRSGFAYGFSTKNITINGAGALLFDYTSKGETLYKKDLRTTELGIALRYAPNEKFYQGATYRTPILTKYPILEFWYDAGVKGIMNSEYNYHSVRFKGEKVFYLSPIGYSDVIVEAGRVFGQVPYPLLRAHRANQTFAYQMESYNLMNFLEFVSDKYASVNIYHNFGGVFFGRVPLLRKLKWREVITFKALWGGVDDKNKPDSDNQLLRFPLADDGKPLTYTLEKKPYIEASVGISNIFRVIRVDLIRRFNYLDHPNVTKTGVRVRFKLEF